MDTPDADARASPPSELGHLHPLTERLLLGAGTLMVLALLVELGLAWLVSPALARGMASGLVAEVFTGREGGIPVAVAADVPALLIWQVSVVQDIAAFCLTYPWFHWAYRRVHAKDNLVVRRLRRIEAAAARHQDYVHKYGPFGVFLFMLVPFLINGPLVGGVLGRLCGIPTRRLMLPVVGSTALAAALWVFFFDQTIGRLESLDPRIGYAVAGTIFVGLLTAAGVGWWLDERRVRSQGPGREE